MSRFIKEYEIDTGLKAIDHNGNYDYRYVDWLEDKLDILEDQNDTIINDMCNKIIDS